MKKLFYILILIASYVHIIGSNILAKTIFNNNQMLNSPHKVGKLDDNKVGLGKVKIENETYFFIYSPIEKIEMNKANIWVVFLRTDKNLKMVDQNRIILNLQRKNLKGEWEFQGRVWCSVHISSYSYNEFQGIIYQRNSHYRVIMEYVTDIVDDHNITKSIFQWQFQTSNE